jgi:hypothetical protein
MRADAELQRIFRLYGNQRCDIVCLGVMEADDIPSCNVSYYSLLLTNAHPSHRCHKFIRYEGAMTMIGINVVGKILVQFRSVKCLNFETAAMMFLRVYAFYKSERPILFGIGFIFLCQISVNTWLLTHGEGGLIHVRALSLD